MFTRGEYVVKANVGVCLIEDIIVRRLTEDSEEKEFYCLAPVSDSRSKVFVPVESDQSNLRRAMTREEAVDLIHEIPDIQSKWIDGDKNREREYKMAMRSNDPRALVGIIKNLRIRIKDREMRGKKITTIDDRYFKLAENALYSEIAHALNRSKDEMKDLIAGTIMG